MVERSISFVPQGRQLFGSLSVQENLEMGGINIKNKKEIDRRVEENMDLFPILKDKQSKKARTLSGGQQQMLALARGLMAEPKLLLLDEPSLGLAPKIIKEVFAKIKEINQRHNTAIIVVEHNIKSLLEIANRAYVLDKGKVVIDESKAETLLKGDRLEKVFLGELQNAVA